MSIRRRSSVSVQDRPFTQATAPLPNLHSHIAPPVCAGACHERAVFRRRIQLDAPTSQSRGAHRKVLSMTRLAAALLAASVMAGCATTPMANAQTPPVPPTWNAPPSSSIQPETTITLNGKGTVDHAPDIAMITVGVSV